MSFFVVLATGIFNIRIIRFISLGLMLIIFYDTILSDICQYFSDIISIKIA